MDNGSHQAFQILRLGFTVAPIIAGLDKFLQLLTNWDKYVAPAVPATLGIAPHTFMMIVGVIEMIVGLAILTKLTRLGAYVATAWLVLIAVNLLLAGQLDVAVRDVAMAVGAYSLGTLAGLKGLAWLPGGAARNEEQWNPHASSIR